MGFGYFDYKNKRYWMGDGNVEMARLLDAEIRKSGRDEKDLAGFLARNALSVTKTVETEFHHPLEQTFVVEQRGPGFEGVPKTEERAEE